MSFAKAKSRQIDRECLPRKKWNVEANYTILSSTLTCASCAHFVTIKVAVWAHVNRAH